MRLHQPPEKGFASEVSGVVGNINSRDRLLRLAKVTLGVQDSEELSQLIRSLSEVISRIGMGRIAFGDAL